jgi:lipopolysaccharide biosynthesis protein
MDKKKIAEEIRHDIDRGVYEQFPKLKERLSFISNKLFNSIYIINSEAQLTEGEIETLIENDYYKY